MALCYNYCGEELGTHDLIGCDADLIQGGIADVIVLSCDSQLTDPSNGTQVQAEIDAGRAFIIKGVKYSLDAASAIEVDSKIANQTSMVTAYDRTGTFMDQNVTQNNIDFYNVLLASGTWGGLILHLADEDVVFWINRPVKFRGSLDIPDGNTDTASFNGTFNYRTPNNAVNPDLYNAPAGIF